MATATNTAIVQFPTPSANWTTPTHFGIFTAITSGNFLGGDQLTSVVVQPTIGANVSFAASALTVVIPNGELTNDGSNDALEDGLLGNSVYVSLHSADPAQTGANELTGGAYARIVVAATGWTHTT